jgi:hypothetical protein
MCNNICLFVCDFCSNFVSEPHTIKYVIEKGIENIVSIESMNNSNQIERKRKFEENIDDNTQNKKFS